MPVTIPTYCKKFTFITFWVSLLTNKQINRNIKSKNDGTHNRTLKKAIDPGIGIGIGLSKKLDVCVQFENTCTIKLLKNHTMYSSMYDNADCCSS